MVGSSPCSNATDPARLSGLMVDRPISLTSIIARVVAGLMPAFCANSAGASSRVPETTGKKPRISGPHRVATVLARRAYACRVIAQSRHAVEHVWGREGACECCSPSDRYPPRSRLQDRGNWEVPLEHDLEF